MVRRGGAGLGWARHGKAWHGKASQMKYHEQFTDALYELRAERDRARERLAEDYSAQQRLSRERDELVRERDAARQQIAQMKNSHHTHACAICDEIWRDAQRLYQLMRLGDKDGAAQVARRHGWK